MALKQAGCGRVKILLRFQQVHCRRAKKAVRLAGGAFLLSLARRFAATLFAATSHAQGAVSPGVMLLGNFNMSGVGSGKASLLDFASSIGVGSDSGMPDS